MSAFQCSWWTALSLGNCEPLLKASIPTLRTSVFQIKYFSAAASKWNLWFWKMKATVGTEVCFTSLLTYVCTGTRCIQRRASSWFRCVYWSRAVSNLVSRMTPMFHGCSWMWGRLVRAADKPGDFSALYPRSLEHRDGLLDTWRLQNPFYKPTENAVCLSSAFCILNNDQSFMKLVVSNV